MVEPKQKPAGKPVHTADKAHLPRTAMRTVWLRTREGTRRLVAEEHRDGQYQEAAAQEERAVDAVASATEAAVGTALRGGKKLAQQAARKRQANRAAEQAENTASRSGTAAAGADDSSFDQTAPYKTKLQPPASARKRLPHGVPNPSGPMCPTSTRAACGMTLSIALRSPHAGNHSRARHPPRKQPRPQPAKLPTPTRSARPPPMRPGGQNRPRRQPGRQHKSWRMPSWPDSKPYGRVRRHWLQRSQLAVRLRFSLSSSSA